MFAHVLALLSFYDNFSRLKLIFMWYIRGWIDCRRSNCELGNCSYRRNTLSPAATKKRGSVYKNENSGCFATTKVNTSTLLHSYPPFEGTRRAHKACVFSTKVQRHLIHKADTFSYLAIFVNVLSEKHYTVYLNKYKRSLVRCDEILVPSSLVDV